MKLIILTLLFATTSIFSFAQGTYDDLKILYADGNYDKLIRKAERYKSKDDTKKDPMVYIWLARGLYKIDLSGTTDDAYKNAFKDALGAIYKARRYDDEGMYLNDPDNKEFIEMLQRSLLERITNEILIEKWRKAFSWTLKYRKISDNLIGKDYLEGACKFRSDDKYSAFTLWREAEEKLSETTSMEDWSDSDIEILKIGALEAAECWVSVRRPEKAKKLLNAVKQWFEDDEDFMQKYDEIVN